MHNILSHKSHAACNQAQHTGTFSIKLFKIKNFTHILQTTREKVVEKDQKFFLVIRLLFYRSVKIKKKSERERLKEIGSEASTFSGRKRVLWAFTRQLPSFSHFLETSCGLNVKHLSSARIISSVFVCFYFKYKHSKLNAQNYV